MIRKNFSNKGVSRAQQFFSILLILSFLLFNPLVVKPASAVEAPEPMAPVDMAIITISEAPPLAIPEFRWSMVSGATKYRLQVSSDVAFTTTAVNITTANTVFTPTSASVLPDGLWYWRVRVETPAISSYSSGWSFTKTWASSDNLPILTVPPDGGTVDFYDSPTFSWTPVPGAATYKFQIYSTPSGWSTLAHSAQTLATTYQPNNKLANGTYYWRVVPVSAGGQDGTPSNEQSFTAGYNLLPTLLEPSDNSNPTFTPTFRWTAVRGAQYYKLQYSTDPSFGASVTTVDTRNTSHTPITTLPNDVNYYWRVQVYSGTSISDWTQSWTFIKKWYIKPVLLTPTNNYQHVRFPIFSWTPVPAAAYYKWEVSNEPGFDPSNYQYYQTDNTANTFMTPLKWDGALRTYYWRVTPYDGNGKAGVSSNTASFRSLSTSVAPHLVYPLFYYPPDTYTGFAGVTTNPHEDRTVALPVFTWHRVLIPAGEVNQGDVYAEAYRLQVSADPTFTIVTWTVDTENTTAAPTAANPFTPLVDTDYFWRVRPLIGGVEVGEWSQIWKTRFDPEVGLDPKTILSLIRPTDGYEFVETTPHLVWFPVTDAPSYEVQISTDTGFVEIIDTATVLYPTYAPVVSFAQRNLGSVDFGVYYWRVRVTGSSEWSDTRRFQIAAQSQWQLLRNIGDSANRLQIGSDPSLDVGTADFDLTDLHAAQSGNYWFFGFHVPAVPAQDLTYALYLDIDHVAGSGATFDARGYTITTIPAYRPEYAIYVLQESGSYSASRVFIYHWTGSAWDTFQLLGTIGGEIQLNTNYVEVKIPNTAIGYQDTTGSYAVTLLSLTAVASGSPLDSVPSDPNVPGSGNISRFSNVSERMNLVAPTDDAGIDPTTIPSILPFFWDWSILSPWSGANMKAYLDSLFTTEAATYQLTSNTPNYARTFHAWDNDFVGDNTYFWRVQPRYKVGTIYYNGAWSQGWRFEREGFSLKPEQLVVSVTFATPTFLWDMVEGAETYDLQVDNDPSFGSPEINVNTRQNTYTHTSTLANGSYYWRVRVKRNGSVINDWSAAKTFLLDLPIPQGLQHTPTGTVNRAPTLCWNPIVQNDPDGKAVLAAWKYRVQVSKDPTFTSNFDTIDTEQACWTPIKGYDDGNYYWRVAMFDGNGKMGNFSPFATLTKQYLTTILISPTSGSTVNGAPTFSWTPVDGAAKYRLEVSIAANFSSTYDSVETNNTTYTPIKVYANNTYYWRVAIIDNNNKVGPYNNATIILDPYPSAFGKTSPVNNAINQPFDLALTWESSSGATSYEYCIDTSNDNACTSTWISTGMENSVSLTGLAAGNWYWQVRARNAFGETYANAGTWWTFNAGNIQPFIDEKLTVSKVTFSWDAVPNATAYKLQLSTNPDFSVLLLNIKVFDTTYFFDTLLVNDTIHYWRVRPLYLDSKGPWSTGWRFESMDQLPAPVLVSPLHKEFVNSPIRLDWNDVERANQYKVQISTDNLFTVKFAKATVLNSFAEFNLPNGKYFWRVRALDIYGGKGAWSEVRIVKIPIITSE